jgi:hypothetical protein
LSPPDSKMKKITFFIATAAFLASALAPTAGFAQSAPLYKDSTQPIPKRVADLLSRMTIEEKFWQLFMIPGDIPPGRRREIQERPLWLPGKRSRQAGRCRRSDVGLWCFRRRKGPGRKDQCHAKIFCGTVPVGHPHDRLRRSIAWPGQRRSNHLSRKPSRSRLPGIPPWSGRWPVPSPPKARFVGSGTSYPPLSISPPIPAGDASKRPMAKIPLLTYQP